MFTDEFEKPPRVKPHLKSASKIRQFYWCDFPKDAQLPEFWKRRPVLIISFRNNLHGTVTVVPCSSQNQGSNQWAHKLENTIDQRESWAICDKLSTVAVSRLYPEKNGIVRLSEAEFNLVLAKIIKWLPVVKTFE
jgi:mRNA interferase MazF